MLITKTYHDVPTKLDPNGRPIRIFVIAPNVPGYPNAKFPGKYPRLHSKGGSSCICRRGCIQVCCRSHSTSMIVYTDPSSKRDLPGNWSRRAVRGPDREPRIRRGSVEVSRLTEQT